MFVEVETKAQETKTHVGMTFQHRQKLLHHVLRHIQTNTPISQSVNVTTAESISFLFPAFTHNSKPPNTTLNPDHPSWKIGRLLLLVLHPFNGLFPGQPG